MEKTPKLLTVDYSLGSCTRRTELYHDEKMIGYLLGCASQLLSYYEEYLKTNVPKSLTLKFTFHDSQLPPANQLFMELGDKTQ